MLFSSTSPFDPIYAIPHSYIFPIPTPQVTKSPFPTIRYHHSNTLRPILISMVIPCPGVFRQPDPALNPSIWPFSHNLYDHNL